MKEERESKGDLRGQDTPKRKVGEVFSKAKAQAMLTRVKAMHTVKDGDTLSDLALKYYGHATKPYYMVIYNANKNIIGDNPNKVKLGLELKIPELPANLKD